MMNQFMLHEYEDEKEKEQVVFDEDDAPELTPEILANAVHLEQIPPQAFIEEAKKRGRGRPKSEQTKTLVTLRLSREVLEFFQSTGPKWRTRIDEYLKKSIHQHP